jgi:hypothetical protein
MGMFDISEETEREYTEKFRATAHPWSREVIRVLQDQITEAPSLGAAGAS